MLEHKYSNSKTYKKYQKRSRIFRFFRNVLIGFFVLLILVLVAGLVYTWYMGQHAVVKENTIPVKTSTKTTKPVQLAPNAKEGAAVQSISSPIAPGSNASIFIKTNRDSKCSITAVYKKVPSKDSGLIPKIADEYGMVSWSWTVERTVPVGKWPVTVTCTWNKKTAVVVGDLVVAK
jgi:hypothetical protein